VQQARAERRFQVLHRLAGARSRELERGGGANEAAELHDARKDLHGGESIHCSYLPN
jgi:hypothetical protein